MTRPKTLVNNASLFTGEASIAGTLSATKIISIEKIEAKIPATTTSLALFFPYTSEIISVIKKVIGYGKMPTEISKRNNPNGFQ